MIAPEHRALVAAPVLPEVELLKVLGRRGVRLGHHAQPVENLRVRRPARMSIHGGWGAGSIHGGWGASVRGAPCLEAGALLTHVGGGGRKAGLARGLQGRAWGKGEHGARASKRLARGEQAACKGEHGARASKRLAWG